MVSMRAMGLYGQQHPAHAADAHCSCRRGWGLRCSLDRGGEKRPFGYLWPLLSAQIPALDALPLDPPLATWIISSLARPWA